jgi:hypothetical protein
MLIRDARFVQALLCFLPQSVEIHRHRSAASLASIPRLTEPPDVFLPQLASELPFPHGFADDLASGSVLTGIDGSAQRSHLFAGKGNAYFLDFGHTIPPKFMAQSYY